MLFGREPRDTLLRAEIAVEERLDVAEFYVFILSVAVASAARVSVSTSEEKRNIGPETEKDSTGFRYGTVALGGLLAILPVIATSLSSSDSSL